MSTTSSIIPESSPSPRHLLGTTHGTPLTRGRWVAGILAVLVTLTSILLANWATSRFGFIPVGFGFQATAGTLFAGIMLATRDAIQDLLGRGVVLLVIGAGAALSFLVASPAVATASVAAFTLAELMDFAVYTPLRSRSHVGDRRWAVAVAASNVVGAVADTAIFIGIAFGTAAILPALPGQLVGKTWATLAYLALGWGLARVVFSRLKTPEA